MHKLMNLLPTGSIGTQPEILSFVCLTASPAPSHPAPLRISSKPDTGIIQLIRTDILPMRPHDSKTIHIHRIEIVRIIQFSVPLSADK